MALWIDKTTPTVGELRTYESGLFDVATAEGIDLDSKIELAREEVSIFLRNYLRTATGAEVPELNNVVLTPLLGRMAALKALSLIYRDAHFGQMSERYRNKWNTYAEESERTQRQLSIEGLGMVGNPLRRPGKPSLSTVAGSEAARIYFVAISWVDGNGTESAASEVASIAAGDGHQLVVTPPLAPPPAAGYLVYVGESADELWRQDTVATAVGESWAMPSAAVTGGTKTGTGQDATYYVRSLNVLPRG